MTEQEFVNGLLSLGYDAYWDEKNKIVQAVLNPETQTRKQLAKDVRETIGWNRSYGSIMLPLPDGTFPAEDDDKPEKQGREPARKKPAGKRVDAPRAPDRDGTAAAKTQRKPKKLTNNAAVEDDEQLDGQMSFSDLWPGGGILA